MNQKDLITVWKVIPLLCAFSFSLLMFVCIFCVNGTISALPFFASYIDAGKSIFVPFIPRINLFYFLPVEAQVLPFTFGHLLDFVIVVNISMVINPIAFPFYKKVNREYQNNLYYDLHLGSRRPRQRNSPLLIGGNRSIFLDRQDVIDPSKLASIKRERARNGIKSARSRDHESKHEHPAGLFSLSRAMSMKCVHGRYRETPSTSASFLHRSRGMLPGRDYFTARRPLARAVFASFFALQPLLFARQR